MGAPQQYDWLGNTASTRDDADGFYDRSLGAITNGGNAGKPYQIHAAQGASNPDRGGRLDATYDAAGNLTRLDVRREATGDNCLGGTSCAMRFAYQWDEVGRLVRARRWDLPINEVGNSEAELPSGNPAADLSYTYDAGDQRVLKTAHDYVNDADSHTAYVFETLELRRAQWVDDGDPATHDYELSEWTEVPYLFANGVRLARVVWHEDANGDPDLPRPDAIATGQYVLLELGDHLGSTNVVLDRATSELVERSTFYAYGAAESDYRPDRWKGFREDYRFTGKEEDVEVGLTYFGKRFLNPLLGRWVSPDPLAVHVPHGQNPPDLNLYAYVRGQVLKNVDPLGLQEDQQSDQAQQDQAVGQDWVSNPDIPADVTIGEPLQVRGDATTADEADEQQAQDDRWTSYQHERAKDPEIAAGAQRQAAAETEKWESRKAQQEALPPGQKVLKALADRHGMDFEGMQRTLEGTLSVVGGGKGPKGGPKGGGLGKQRAAVGRIAGRIALRRMGLDRVRLARRSYGSGRKQLESSGFQLERTTDTGRRVFVNPRTGAQVAYDSGKALAPGQKAHWHIIDVAGRRYTRTGRVVDRSSPAGHIPAR